MPVVKLSRNMINGELFVVTYDDIIHFEEALNMEDFHKTVQRMLPYAREYPVLDFPLVDYASWVLDSPFVTVVNPVVAPLSVQRSPSGAGPTDSPTLL